MDHQYNTRSNGTIEPESPGFRLSVKELLAPARQAPEDKRKVFHGSMQGDILTPPDTVKSSKSIVGDKQYSDMAKSLFKTPPPGYNAKAFQSPFTIPPVTTPCTMPKTFVPEYSSTPNLPVATVSATINDGYGTFIHNGFRDNDGNCYYRAWYNADSCVSYDGCGVNNND